MAYGIGEQSWSLDSDTAGVTIEHPSIVDSRSNKALPLTAIPLRFIATGSLGLIWYVNAVPGAAS